MGIRFKAFGPNIPEPPKVLNTGTQVRSLSGYIWLYQQGKELPRKAVCIASVTVPQTDTGRRVEYTQARE